MVTGCLWLTGVPEDASLPLGMLPPLQLTAVVK
jgi:hypothetical protein